MSSTNNLNWDLCCLCQQKNKQPLQTPTENGMLSLEKDINNLSQINPNTFPAGINVTLSQLDDGSGIAETLKIHKAKYHKMCRSFVSSSRVKRASSKLNNDASITTHSSPKKLRSSDYLTVGICCVICEEKSPTNLHKVETDAVDVNLKCWAKINKNVQLLGRLTVASDAHAADFYYHRQCYTQLRDSARATERSKDVSPAIILPFDSIICAQIVTMIENAKSTVFKLSELREIYQKLMCDNGHPCRNKKDPHATRFKDHLLSFLPEWKEFSTQKYGRKDIFISNNSKVVEELKKAFKSQLCQEDALTLMRAAVIMHNLCLRDQPPFNGSFSSDCQTVAVSEELMSFLNIVLQGPDPLQRNEDGVNVNKRQKIARNISQLLIFNASKGTHHICKVAEIRHNKERETPFPLYHGLKLHGQGRNRKQIDIDHAHGLSVSYSRIMEVKKDIARAVCARHAKDGVVLPTNIRLNVFSTHDVDNIDSKAQGNFSQDEFHGYALSVTNHLSHDNQGKKRPPICINPIDTKKPQLPDDYVIHTPIHLTNANVFASLYDDSRRCRPQHNLHGAKVKDEVWMAHTMGVLKKETLTNSDIITWSGYNSRMASEESVKPPAEIGIYPLFPNKAACASSMKHAMELTMKSTKFINQGQTSVLGADQPLYAIIKRIQWQYPDTLGESKLVAMMGALHIEDKMHLMIGKLLRDSGWATVLSQAEVLTSGRAESVLNEHKIKRTRYAHQVTLMSLYLLKQTAYTKYSTAVVGPTEPFEMWNRRNSDSVPQFQFWSMIMDLELMMARFIRSLREGNFELYVQSCDELCGWFHVLDHVNYARWLPVHVRDMVTLPDTHPAIYAEFMKGNFVVQKSAKKFSLIAKDQSHEQSNRRLQEHGGAVGLYENPDNLTLFMLTGPDCSRIVKEFETDISSSVSNAHHVEGHSFQVMFRNDVISFVKVVEELNNPFCETSHELYALDTHSVMESAVVRSLSKIRETGQSLYNTYVTERLEKATVPVTDTIKRNNILTFANRPNIKKKKGNNDKGILKHNMSLVTQLFLSIQSRPDVDMAEFFKFENLREPPSLADQGLLRSGTKSDILQCLDKSTICQPPDVIKTSVVVLDMAAVVHMVRPTNVNTFNEYVKYNIIPFLKAQLKRDTQRMDAVWDNYPECNNLKLLTQQRRGNGSRTKVGDGNTKIPKQDWNGFLKNEENKKELFPFISEQIVQNDMCGKLLISNRFDAVLSNRECDVSSLQSCNHSEADTRIILHLSHAAKEGHFTAYIRTVDSDVVILAIHFFETLKFKELWVGFGTGKHYRDIPVHTIFLNLGPTRCVALPLFHSLTGCDTTSQFLGIGKKTAWSTWNSTSTITKTLVELINHPLSFDIESEHMRDIERFIVLMYNKGCGFSKVNEARHHMFITGRKSLEKLPPTQAALFQHVKRALLQASFYWSQAIIAHQNIPDFGEWGWQRDDSNNWKPLWTTLTDASVACAVLMHCGCLKTCAGRCKCSRAGVRCTSLCKCEGGCSNYESHNA